MRDRAISTEFSTHRVSKECETERFRRNFRPTGYLGNVIFIIFKKFSPPQKWRPFWIFEFLPKMAKHKFASISLTVRDRAFRRNFRPTGYLRNAIFAIFKKFSPPQKWRPFWIFEFLPKMAKRKFASISLTVRDRAISSKFSTHRVVEEYSVQNWKFSIFATFGGHLEFFRKTKKS